MHDQWLYEKKAFLLIISDILKNYNFLRTGDYFFIFSFFYYIEIMPMRKD